MTPGAVLFPAVRVHRSDGRPQEVNTMMATFGRLTLAPWILFLQMSWTMDAVPVITSAPSAGAEAAVTIRDGGDVFGREAERRALAALRQVHRRHGTSVSIETVRSLDGARIADVAKRRARGDR